MKKLAIIIFFLVIAALAFVFNPFRAPGKIDKTEIVVIDSTSWDSVALKLHEDGFIRSFTAFNIALGIKGKYGKIEPGGYYLSKNMDTWKIIEELSNGADLKEVTVLPGMRKEQIGEKLKEILDWSDEKVLEWNNTYKSKPEYAEGVYFPDTYLIPVNENSQEVADRMINNFNEKFAPYASKFTKKDIKWTTALKIASLIQREAGGPSDMKLISGVLWNRLLEGQKLDIDATIQYAKGETNGKWWPVVTGSDIRNIDSLYNTYKYAGLPPTPIANPGLAAIEAVLNPQNTDCLFYLHDPSRQIHCSKTYEEHLENINKYLN